MKSPDDMKDLDFTGERAIIGSEAIPKYIIEEHVARYGFACRFALGRCILDVACGSGYGSHMLCQAGAKSVLGIDISSESINYASRFAEDAVKFVQGDAQYLDLSDDSFDLVVSFETIEHTVNPKQFLSEVKRVLKPGGILIISTPNRHHFSPFYWVNRRPRNKYHLFEVNSTEFLELLSGFFVVDKVYGQHLLPTWVGWWPVLSTLKLMSLILGKEDRIYSSIVTYGGSEVQASQTTYRTGRVMIALCSNLK
jgi:SAM-dependent methyltransferase